MFTNDILIKCIFFSSSRSHLIFLINIEGHDKTSGAVTTGNLMLCDLAGSERVSKTDAQGQRLIEAAAINKSLTSLGQVGSGAFSNCTLSQHVDIHAQK